MCLLHFPHLIFQSTACFRCFDIRNICDSRLPGPLLTFSWSFKLLSKQWEWGCVWCSLITQPTLPWAKWSELPIYCGNIYRILSTYDNPPIWLTYCSRFFMLWYSFLNWVYIHQKRTKIINATEGYTFLFYRMKLVYYSLKLIENIYVLAFFKYGSKTTYLSQSFRSTFKMKNVTKV